MPHYTLIDHKFTKEYQRKRLSKDTRKMTISTRVFLGERDVDAVVPEMDENKTTKAKTLSFITMTNQPTRL